MLHLKVIFCQHYPNNVHYVKIIFHSNVPKINQLTLFVTKINFTEVQPKSNLQTLMQTYTRFPKFNIYTKSRSCWLLVHCPYT